MSVDFGHHDTNVLQDSVSELAFAANGTVSWSTDGRLDPSLFEFDMCVSENNPTGIGSIQIPISKM
jgi:hypothetical protein